MKRKRNSDDIQTYDLVLIDANGRSIRAHKALLIDKSDYFAKILNDNNLHELQLNENYLVELIHYLYSCEIEDSPSTDSQMIFPFDSYQLNDINQDNAIVNGDIEVLMQLLVLSRKYGFAQLYQKLMGEINYRLGPSTVLIVYRCAQEMDIKDVKGSTKMMILSWLSQLQTTKEFLRLPEESIYDILSAEPLDVESESKLNALSAWWSHNKEADMTNLWVQLINCTYR